MKNSGLSWYQVAERVPYLDTEGNPSPAFACVDVSRALKRARREIVSGLEEMVQMADLRDDDLRLRLRTILQTKHYLVQGGKIVKDDNGEPIRDYGPVLAAIDRLHRLEERYAVRHGLNAPEKLNIALERRTDVEATVVTEAILAGFDAAELPADVRMRALEAAQSRLTTIEGEVVSESTDD